MVAHYQRSRARERVSSRCSLEISRCSPARPLAWPGREPINLPGGLFARVRYASIADQIPHRSELTLCAMSRPSGRGQDGTIRACTAPAGMLVSSPIQLGIRPAAGKFLIMRRREFVTFLGGAIVPWPLAARAQQPAKLPTIGFLGATTPSGQNQWTAAFVQRLRDLGWIEGRTAAIEYRWAEGRSERYVEIAAEFVRLKVDVIVAGGNAAVAAKQATSVVPIVFVLAV